MVDPTVPRRSFLARLAAGGAAFGAAFAGAATLPVVACATPAATPPADELDTWFAGMTGANKIIYDAVQQGGGPEGIMFARNLLKFSLEKLGTKDSDFSVILSFRHFATPFGYNDAAWAKYPQVAQMLHLDDPKTKKAATRNVWLHDEVEGEAGANLPGLVSRGVQFAVCGAATSYIAKLLAGSTGDAQAIEDDLKANLIPNARIVPAGVVAVQRAQKAGFAYTYAG
jgi:intracellular sulfur oxidation DsrE/DsrF family protein